jgi:hypothetical protein
MWFHGLDCVVRVRIKWNNGLRGSKEDGMFLPGRGSFDLATRLDTENILQDPKRMRIARPDCAPVVMSLRSGGKLYAFLTSLLDVGA